MVTSRLPGRNRLRARIERSMGLIFTAAFLTIALVWSPSAARADQALDQLIRQGADRQIAAYLEARPDRASERDAPGLMPIHSAVRAGELRVVNILLSYGADPNAIEELEGGTPLHAAARFGFPTIARFLLSRGAFVSPRDRHGNTPLHEAARNGHAEVVAVLLTHRAQVNLLNLLDETPLHLAAETNPDQLSEEAPSRERLALYLRILRSLLDHGAELEIRDFRGRTPFIRARENAITRDPEHLLRRSGAWH